MADQPNKDDGFTSLVLIKFARKAIPLDEFVDSCCILARAVYLLVEMPNITPKEKLIIGHAILLHNCISIADKFLNCELDSVDAEIVQILAKACTDKASAPKMSNRNIIMHHIIHDAYLLNMINIPRLKRITASIKPSIAFTAISSDIIYRTWCAWEFKIKNIPNQVFFYTSLVCAHQLLKDETKNNYQLIMSGDPDYIMH